MYIIYIYIHTHTVCVFCVCVSVLLFWQSKYSCLIYTDILFFRYWRHCPWDTFLVSSKSHLDAFFINLTWLPSIVQCTVVSYLCGCFLSCASHP